MTLDSTLKGLEQLATLALAVELEDLTRQQWKTGDDLDTELSKSTVGVVATGAERLESVTVTVFAGIYV